MMSSPHGGADNRPQLPNSVIAMPRIFRSPIIQVPNLAANLLKPANNQVLPASVRRDENMPDVPQNAPAARCPSVEVTRKQVVGNNGAKARMLLPPKSGLSSPSKSSANGVGAARQRKSGGTKNAEQQQPQGDANAVDIKASTRFDNISNNILAHLQCAMDTFHSFELSPVFLNYIRYDHKGKKWHLRTNKIPPRGVESMHATSIEASSVYLALDRALTKLCETDAKVLENLCIRKKF